MTGRKPARKTVHHPHVGTLPLSSQSMDLEGTPGQSLGVYIAEPGTPDHDAMILLDIWSVVGEVWLAGGGTGARVGLVAAI